MLPFEIEGEGAFAGGMGLDGWEGNVGASGVVPLLTVHLSIPLRISMAVKYFFQQKKKKERGRVKGKKEKCSRYALVSSWSNKTRVPLTFPIPSSFESGAKSSMHPNRKSM